MIRLAAEVDPLTTLMRAKSLESPVVQADETPTKLLNPGHGQVSTAYL